MLKSLSVLLLLLCALTASADGTKPGPYDFTDRLDGAKPFLKVTLTPARNGQFTVQGSWQNTNSSIEGLWHNATISGSLTKTGKLHARLTYRNRGQTIEKPVDGEWAEGELVLISPFLGHQRFYGHPRGDAWVCDGPEIQNKGSGRGSATMITASVTADGKTGDGTITISGIPTHVRDGEHITITLTASASPPASMAGWVNRGDIGQVLSDQAGVSTNSGKLSGTFEVVFHGGPNAYLQISGGIADVGWSLVTFKYHKAK